MQTPTLVLPGRDLAHPGGDRSGNCAVGANAELRLGWQAAAGAVRAFLQAHTHVSKRVA